MSRSKTHPTLNVERFGAGVYMVKAYGTDRVWTVTSNEQLRPTPWVAYVVKDKDTVLDPFWTLRQALSEIAEIEARAKHARVISGTGNAADRRVLKALCRALVDDRNGGGA
jgi:hypothetical protein